MSMCAHKDFGDCRTANWRDVTEAVGRSELNIRRCSIRRSCPYFLDFMPGKCDIMHSVSGSRGGLVSRQQ